MRVLSEALDLGHVGDGALFSLFELVDADGPGTPREQAPRLCHWLWLIVCMEKARRLGEKLVAIDDPVFTPEERAVAVHVVAAIVAPLDVLGRAAAASGQPLTARQETTRRELRERFLALAECLMGPRPGETTH